MSSMSVDVTAKKDFVFTISGVVIEINEDIIGSSLSKIVVVRNESQYNIIFIADFTVYNTFLKNEFQKEKRKRLGIGQSYQFGIPTDMERFKVIIDFNDNKLEININ